MKNPDYLSVAKKIVAERFSDSDCVFVAGSITTGHGTPSSDIDMIILYDDETHESYRDSIIQEGWPVELFVHNIKSQNYFFNEDIKNGHASTLTMVRTGHVIGNETLGNKRKTIAEQLFLAGPERLSADKINAMRYSITDLFDDLRHPKDPDYIPALLAELFPRIGNFYLRSQNKWSGIGKQLVKLLKKEHPEFTVRYLSAFEMARIGKLEELETLINYTLAPYGGMLFEHYKSVAKDWK